LAVRDPDRISGLLMIDSVVFPPPDVLAALKQLAAILAKSGLDGGLQYAAGLLFLASDDAGMRARILEIMAATPSDVAAAALDGHLFDYDPAPALAACKVPVGYIAASALLADPPKMRRLCPHLMSAQTLGAGHFSQLLVPDQINTMIQTFLGIVARPD
jgi:pimeloyl-ACP methyl ester carboxylesterase